MVKSQRMFLKWDCVKISVLGEHSISKVGLCENMQKWEETPLWSEMVKSLSMRGGWDVLGANNCFGSGSV